MHGDVWVHDASELVGVVVALVARDDERAAVAEGREAAEGAEGADGEEDRGACGLVLEGAVVPVEDALEVGLVAVLLRVVARRDADGGEEWGKGVREERTESRRKQGYNLRWAAGKLRGRAYLLYWNWLDRRLMISGSRGSGSSARFEPTEMRPSLSDPLSTCYAASKRVREGGMEDQTICPSDCFS